MAINPINVSRVTSNLRTDALLQSLRRNTAELFFEQNRLAVGRQFLSPSEDPGRAARALNLREILDQQSQLVTNIRHAADTMDAADAAMAAVSALIIDAQAIASQEVGTLASRDERRASAEVIQSIREQLVATGNRQFEGRYLFAGRDTNTQPFVSALGGVAYVGDTGDIFARVDFHELEPINISGNDLFGALSERVVSFTDLTPLIQESTRLEDLLGATNQGIRPGTIQIEEDGGAGIVNIDLSGADTVGDVVDQINQAMDAASGSVTASLSGNGIVITPGGPAITIRDVSTGTTAMDLGLVTTAPTNAAITGSDLGVALTRTTNVQDLAGGAAIDLASGIVVRQGNRQVTVDLSSAETVQDILNAINNSGMQVRAQINASRTGIDVLNNVSGSTMAIGENGGTTATDLGIRSMHEATGLADLNNGLGLRTVEGKTDIAVRAKDGTSFEVNLDGALTVQDVIDAINAAATTAGVAVTASLATTGNGIQLTDATGGTDSLAVLRANVSFAIDDLGLEKTVPDPDTVLVGDDVNGAEVNGVISALYAMERALLEDDSQALSIASEDVDVFLNDFNRVRGIVGARAKAMRDRLAQTEEASFATQSILSDVQDLDYTESITKFQQAQTTLQATLLTGSQVLNISLMNFLG